MNVNTMQTGNRDARSEGTDSKRLMHRFLQKLNSELAFGIGKAGNSGLMVGSNPVGIPGGGRIQIVNRPQTRGRKGKRSWKARSRRCGVW